MALADAKAQEWIAAALKGIEVLQVNARHEGPSADGSEWKEHSKRPDCGGMVVYQSSVPGSSYARFKAVFTLPYAPSVVSSFVRDPISRISWDASLNKIEPTKLAEDERGFFAISHSETKAVGPISSRDFVDAVAIVNLPGGGIANGGSGIDDTASFPERKGIVRGYNSPGGGWLFEPVLLDEKVHTRMIYIIHCNLKGWLPSAVVNGALTGNYVTFYKDLTKAMAAKCDPEEGQEAARAAMAGK